VSLPGERPSIGYPISGATVYLLDESGEPVPAGSPGEIYIGGGGVGRGYRNLEEATAAYFLADPFSGVSGGRMFRTGDRGIRRPDGQIEFLGRNDRQVKIRGQRIELDEIAAVLSQHPKIQFATTNVHLSATGEKQLVGYVLPFDNAAAPNSDELQIYLLQRVPDYMVPPFFVRLYQVPESHSGKIDWKALPAPNEENLLERTPSIAASTPIEETLLTLMRNLLEDSAVEVDDNFFLAGGHSLLGMQLVMRVQEECGIDLTLQQIYEAPTVSRLAKLIEKLREEQRLATTWADLLGRNEVGIDDNFFEVGGNSEMLAVLQQRIKRQSVKDIPVAELFQNPTIRQQTELILKEAKSKAKLPAGVVPFQLAKGRQTVFWVHYLHIDLAREWTGEQQIVFVRLTLQDLETLGGAPTLQSIAACMVSKILTSQPTGPYILGGLCLGGILAYEVAVQLRAAGAGVASLILLDSPNPSCVKPQYSTTPKLWHAGYILKRISRLGARRSILTFRTRVFRSSPKVATAAAAEKFAVQQLIETAATSYQPPRYEGNVLLLLAADRAPNVNFLSGWKAVVARDLQVKYVNAHHTELTKMPHVRDVAEAIASHLQSQTAAVRGETECIESTNAASCG
jgi:thioesterase domain-containing protein/aryl carrier-like protein